MRKLIVCTDVVPRDASLLCTLYAAVHYLLENPITTNGLPNLPQPFKVFDQFTNLKIGAMSDVFLNNATQTMHKVYHETEFMELLHLRTLPVSM